MKLGENAENQLKMKEKADIFGKKIFSKMRKSAE